MRGGRMMLTTLTVALVVACTSSVSATTRLVDYAAGDWGCRFRSGTLTGARLAVRVRATGDASGTVEIRFVHAVNGPQPLTGSWRLDGDRLTFRPVVMSADGVDSSLGPVYGRNVRLDTHRVTMRGEMPHRPGSGNPVPVTVRRDGDRVTFGTDALGIRFPGAPKRTTIACTKGA